MTTAHAPPYLRRRLTMDTVWPQPRNHQIEFPVENGASVTSKRPGSPKSDATFVVNVSQAEKVGIMNWFANTLKFGSIKFYFINDAGAQIVCRFVGPPDPRRLTKLRWRVFMPVEVD